MAGLRGSTRVAHLSPAWARMLLATLLLMTAIGIVSTTGSERPGLRLGSAEKSDAALYRAVSQTALG